MDFFFVNDSCDHRDRHVMPHSFPTRRSSDLVALDDRCPHRRASLSKGALVGDNVQCGYHGITFDCSGSCVSIPGQDTTPASMSSEEHTSELQSLMRISYPVFCLKKNRTANHPTLH